MSIFDTLFGKVKRIISEGGDVVHVNTKPSQLPVQFGVPTTQLPQPTLPKTSNTTGQLVTPKPYVPPVPVQPQPKINPLDIIKQGKDIAISQGTEAPKKYGTTGLFEGVLSGTGRKEQPSVNFELKPFRAQANELLKRSVAERGLLPGIGNFIFEGFNARSNPSPEQYTDRLGERVEKLTEIGLPEEQAWNVAAQDIFNESKYKSSTGLTMSGKRVQVPQNDLGIELTQEQNEALLSINAKEALFEVLDSPIFIGSAKGISLALKGKNLIKATKYNDEMTATVNNFVDVVHGNGKFLPEEAVAIKRDAQIIIDSLAERGFVAEESRFLKEKSLANLLKKHMDSSRDAIIDAERTATEAGKKNIGKATYTKGTDGKFTGSKKPTVSPVENLTTPKLKPESVSSKNLTTEAKKFDKPEDFVDAYIADSLLDISTPERHRFGRIYEDGVFEDTGEYLDVPTMKRIYGHQYSYNPEANIPNISNPETLVTIYRGTRKAQKELMDGDFVSFSKEYALSHNEGEKLLTKQVPAKDVVWQQNDFNEWVYSPESLRGKKYDGGLTKIWAEANGVDPLEADPYFKFAKKYKSGKEFADAFASGRPEADMIKLWNKANKPKSKGIFATAKENLSNPAMRQGGFALRVPKEFPKKATPKKKPNPFIKINAEIKEIRNSLKNKDVNKAKIGEIETRIDLAEEALPDVADIRRIGGKQLREGDTVQQIQATAMKKRELNPIAQVMDITEANKALKNQKAHNAKTLEAARLVKRANLDDAVTEMGYNSLDEAQEAVETFNKSKEVITELRHDIKPLKAQRTLANKVTKVVQVSTTERRSYVKFLANQFQLSDANMKSLVNNRDFRTMGDAEFSSFINKLEQKAVEVADTRQAKTELMALLEDKNFIRVENYRKAQQLPPVSQMNKAQFKQYAESLEEFSVGDEFLSKRTLETIDRTPLEGVRTMREVREKLLTQLKKDPQFKGLKMSDIEGMTADALDMVRYDTALAEKNPFYNLLVTRTQTEIMRAKSSFLTVQDDINKLTKLANASRKKTVFGKVKDTFVPKQTEVIKYLEAPTPEAKALVAKNLTKEELDLASYMEQYYRGAYDHLVKIEELKGSRYADAYFTHTKKKFLERWSDDGMIDAVRGWFESNADQAKIANIIDQDTGQILPKSKFFQYTLRRTGEVAPSENATQVFLNYAQQFERKKMFDNIIPELDVYTQALTPSQLTKNGLEMDRSLKTFVNKYLNNKKARRENFGGLVKQGGKADITLRAGNTFVSLMDLGLNVFASVATNVGELVATYQALGKRATVLGFKRRIWDTGLKRMSDPNAAKILKEAEPFIGRNFWTELGEANIPLTDKGLTTIFAPFSQASVETNKIFLLARLSDEELKLGKISPERMASLRLEAGRWRDMGADVKSIVGSTSVGATATKYKNWAVPIARTNIKNLSDIADMLKKGQVKGAVTSKQMQETYRAIEATLIIYTVGNYVLAENDENTFVGKLNARIQMEAMTIMGGVDPTLFLSAPRLLTYVQQLAKNLKTFVSLEEYKSSGIGYEEGDSKGATKIKKQLTPSFIKQFQKRESTTGDKELDAAVKADNKASDEASKEAEQLTKEIQSLPKEEAKAKLLEISKTDEKLAEKVLDNLEEASLGLTSKDKAIKSLGVQSGARADYIVTQINKLDSKEEKKAYLLGLSNKKILSDKVLDQVLDKLEEPQTKTITQDERNLVENIGAYYAAFKVDKGNAWKALTTREQLGKVEGNLVEMKRFYGEDFRAEEGSEAYVYKMLKEMNIPASERSNYNLEHIVPVSAGGDSSPENLKIVTREVHNSYTQFDIDLGKRVKSGEITRKEAEVIAREHKK